jgi:hypothetical protein
MGDVDTNGSNDPLPPTLTPGIPFLLYPPNGLSGTPSTAVYGGEHVCFAFLSLFPSLKDDLSSADLLLCGHALTDCPQNCHHWA